MNHLEDAISKAGKEDIESALRAVVKQYETLFPDWELQVISINRLDDQNAQLDQIIRLLQAMKSDPS